MTDKDSQMAGLRPVKAVVIGASAGWSRALLTACSSRRRKLYSARR